MKHPLCTSGILTGDMRIKEFLYSIGQIERKKKKGKRN
jgi:hypothetical protein